MSMNMTNKEDNHSGAADASASRLWAKKRLRSFVLVFVVTVLSLINLLNIQSAVSITANLDVSEKLEEEGLPQQHRQQQQRVSTSIIAPLVTTKVTSSTGPQPSSETILAELYKRTTINQTPNTTNSTLGQLFEPYILETYPHLKDIWNKPDNKIKVGTPSLTKIGDIVVLGQRIETPHPSGKWRKSLNYLLLCTINSDMQLHCQDSGISNDYIPPECSAEYWYQPQVRTLYGFTTTGPEDARLYLQSETMLVATFGMRGCHPGTKFNESAPNYSIYTTTWTKAAVSPPASSSSSSNWKLDGPPKLLDLRARDGSSLGEEYPAVTKNLIKLPSTQDNDFIVTYGWSRSMKDHFMYAHPASSKQNDQNEEKDTNSSITISSIATTLLAMVPFTPISENPDTDIEPYYVSKYRRGSTNYVEFAKHDLLLALGHVRRHSDDAEDEYVYFHYWYAICNKMPYTHVAHSDEFRLTTNNFVSFALGLAIEGDYLYVSASENDQRAMLLQYSVESVEELLFGNTESNKTRRGLPIKSMSSSSLKK